MLYFKIKRGFNKNDDIKITGKEVQKVLHAWLTGNLVFLDVGFISGKTITSIEIDTHEILGYRADANIDNDDMQMLKNSGELDMHKEFMMEQRDIIKKLQDAKRTDLIGVYTKLEAVNITEQK